MEIFRDAIRSTLEHLALAIAVAVALMVLIYGLLGWWKLRQAAKRYNRNRPLSFVI